MRPTFEAITDLHAITTKTTNSHVLSDTYEQVEMAVAADVAGCARALKVMSAWARLSHQLS
jgi:hypothetical protein